MKLLAGSINQGRKRFSNGILLVAILVTITTCEKRDFVEKTAVITGEVTNIMTFEAQAEGSVVDIGGGVTDHGHCWSTQPDPTTADKKASLGTISKNGTFNSIIKELDPGQTYYIRAYAVSGNEVAYGAQETFTTLDGIPILTTSTIADITATSATSGGVITDDGGDAITARGICWNTTGDPTISDNKTGDGSGTGSFSSSITGLSPNTTYYVKAYATNSLGTVYGDAQSFTTLDGIPILTTSTIADITATLATSGGVITDDGGDAITARGVCWNTTGDPTISDNKTGDGSGTGSFSSSITGLSPNTIYYVKAYATNSLGTVYGDAQSFTTLDGIPILTTTSIAEISTTSAISGGDITDDGDDAITARGVCWNTTGDPTISDIKTVDGSGTGSFSSSITGLSPNTTYYVRAYATNSRGTGYGDIQSFTTLDGIPLLTTTTITEIFTTSAISGGDITDDGDDAITARGVCWNTTGDPTISDSKTVDGSVTGSFSSSLTGLSPNTTYYVRAYATNSRGTGYGDIQSFTTLGPITDIDGNTYQIVVIGSQIWMAENLRTTKYNDGTPIDYPGTDNTAWANKTTGAYAWYNNDQATYADTYGALYNWYVGDAASNGGKNVCPAGWHVPSDAEWTVLTDFLGGESVAGGKLKETGTTHWTSPNTGATDEVGFSGLPGGFRSGSGYFALGDIGYWWSSSESSTTDARVRFLHHYSDDAVRSTDNKTIGESVRCLRD